MGGDGCGHWLVGMEWRPAGWSVCLPLLIFPCTTKSRSSLLAPAHPGGPGNRAVKRLCVCVIYTRDQLEDAAMELRRRDLRQLKKRVTSLVQEKQLLVSNIGDAEAALRTLDQYGSNRSVVL